MDEERENQPGADGLPDGSGLDEEQDLTDTGADGYADAGYGDPAGEQGADQGYPEAEAGPEAANAQASEQPQPYQPQAPTYRSSVLTLEEEERLNELAVTNPAAAMREVVGRMLLEHDAVMAVSGYHLQQAEAAAPEFFRVHRPTIQHAIASLPPEQRGSKDSVAYGVLFAIGQEAQQTGDLWGALERAVELRKRNTGTPTAPRPPIPPSQRPTAPAVGAGAVRGSASMGPRGVSGVVKTLMDVHGLTRSEAEQVARGLGK